MSLWNVADYTRWRTGGDDPVLEEFARRHTLGGARVLDLGCGPGHAAAALAERHGAVVTGLDASSEMLAAAREVASTVTLVHGAADDMPFEDGSFDIVLSNFVVHLLDRPAAFAEVYRVLAKGGIYWIKTQDPETIRDYWVAPLFPSVVGIETARFPSESRLRDELVAAGFRDVHVERRGLERVFSRDEAIEKLASGAYSTLQLLPLSSPTASGELRTCFPILCATALCTSWSRPAAEDPRAALSRGSVHSTVRVFVKALRVCDATRGANLVAAATVGIMATLKTHRLHLGRWDARHREAWRSICRDREVMRFIGPGQPWDLTSG